MNTQTRLIIVILLVFASCASADIFTHRTTGEKLYGYPSQKTLNGKMHVYIQNEINFSSKIFSIADYDVKYDTKGRRNSIIVIPINQEEILISKAVADILSKTIKEASNKGPRYIILEIDCPGGRGDYMNIVCKAITDTTNCPVIAYITGEKFGGAYSTAAAVALACNKIYIAPTASIGSASPAHGAITARTGFDEYAKTYTPENLSSYSAYVAKLAETNKRPGVMAAALMDKNIEVLEVTVNTERKRKFINSIDKSASQVTAKRWSQAINEPVMNSQESTDEQIKTNILTLNSEDAIYCKMADKIANSQTELIADLGAEDTKIIKSSSAIAVTRQFIKNRKTMNSLLSSIEQRETMAEKIDTQITNLTARNNTIDIRLNSQRQNYNDYNRRNNRDNTLSYNSSKARRLRREQNNMNNQQMRQNNPVDIERYRLTTELAGVLNGLIGDYRQVIAISRRFPGTIPTDLSINMVESNLTATRMRLFSLQQY